jgi:hypothetical protein
VPLSPPGTVPTQATGDQTPPAAPVRVDQFTRRSDNDALEGGKVKVVGGEHEGQEGAFVKVAQYDSTDGYPTKIVVKFFDTTYTHELAEVEYEHVRPA